MIAQRVPEGSTPRRLGLAGAGLALLWALSFVAWADEPAPTSAPASQPAASATSSGDPSIGQRGLPQTEEARTRLAEEIRARARQLAETKETGAESGAQKAPPRDKSLKVPPVRASAKPGVPPALGADKPGEFGPEPQTGPPAPGRQLPDKGQPPAAKGGGCGDAGQVEAAKLAPPPEDQPQPKLLVENPKIELDVWRGEPAVFRFKLKNEGQAPLNVLLKGG